MSYYLLFQQSVRNPAPKNVVHISNATTSKCVLKTCIFQKILENKNKSINNIHNLLQDVECKDSCCNVTLQSSQLGDLVEKILTSYTLLIKMRRAVGIVRNVKEILANYDRKTSIRDNRHCVTSYTTTVISRQRRYGPPDKEY
ncbi:hypothetical protein QTP88_027311 [Uroleucon formosanum]